MHRSPHLSKLTEGFYQKSVLIDISCLAVQGLVPCIFVYKDECVRVCLCVRSLYIPHRYIYFDHIWHGGTGPSWEVMVRTLGSRTRNVSFLGPGFTGQTGHWVFRCRATIDLGQISLFGIQ
jgi:hypothetical protein